MTCEAAQSETAERSTSGSFAPGGPHARANRWESEWPDAHRNPCELGLAQSRAHVLLYRWLWRERIRRRTPVSERSACFGITFEGPLPGEAIEALLANFAASRIAGESRELDWMPWGGAYNPVSADATAFPNRSARFLLKHTVVFDRDMASAQKEAARRWLARSWESVHPWGTGGVYVNFPDPDLRNPQRADYSRNLERLIAVKRRYDPEDVIGFR